MLLVPLVRLRRTDDDCSLNILIRGRMGGWISGMDGMVVGCVSCLLASFSSGHFRGRQSGTNPNSVILLE
jgi:hypothetical protein